MKLKAMKLEGALKLYTVLYFLAFLFTFMMSVPMLKHVMPKSECLLFVQVQYFFLHLPNINIDLILNRKPLRKESPPSRMVLLAAALQV